MECRRAILYALAKLCAPTVYNNQYLVALLHLLLGGDPCQSVGDQPPLLTPRGDPARLGDLSADPPLVDFLYSF